jgi:DNA-binding XRE family transcriptional regulator
MRNSREWQYVMSVSPFIKEEDLECLEYVNQYDLLIVFRNGEKILYDTFNGYFRSNNESSYELSDEQHVRIFNRNLRSILNRKRITQSELAEATDTSQTMISRYITGECLPNALMLYKIARALNCSIDDLFYKEY